MNISKKEAERIFNKLQVNPKTSTHHVAGVIVIDGAARLPVHYSHTRKGLQGRAAHLFRKSLRLQAEEFAVLKRCTMTREEYLALVRDRAHA